MSANQLPDAEKQALRAAREQGGLTKAFTYLKFSGPGWLQGAITLGGGSLTGALYLGVLAGYQLLWVQLVAMAMGVIMLSAIAYVTLSTGKRPFQAIKDHINPVLAWSWAIATLMANIVWCLPQFSLGVAAVRQNLLPGLLGAEAGLSDTSAKLIVSLALLVIATAVIWFYDSGGRGIKIFEALLKGMVAVVVISFFGVVAVMTFQGGLNWGEVLSGFIPNLGYFNRPAASFDGVLAATGAFQDYWSGLIVADQRDVMITAAATAVGINMTFLLPYSMLARGWGKEFRGLATFDLSTGLLIPYLLATSCVVIAAASQFHAQPATGFLGERTEQGELIQPAGNLVGGFDGLLDARLAKELGAATYGALSPDEKAAARAALPEADRRVAAMLVKRDAFNLADSLSRLTGRTWSHIVFGIGVLGMALSTIIILMLISGFTVCEMLGIPPTGNPRRFACLISGVGILGPFIWTGKSQFWLAVPTSVFGFMLLPIAFWTFFGMMNSKKLMGEDLPKGGKRVVWNTLMLVALTYATIGAAWNIWSRTQLMFGVQIRWIAIGVVAFIVISALIVHIRRRGPEQGSGG
jgi:Mn2+/Fe2+ NRAMP family transporter